MEIKGFVIETFYENAVGLRFIDDLDIKWEIDGSDWVLYHNNKRVPHDWKVIYTCEKCGREARDYLNVLKNHKYEAICKRCREDYEPQEAINGWREVDGHKLQGEFEEMVALWLTDHNIKFQTHGKITKEAYYYDFNGKKKKYLADFYLPDYDLFLEPYSIITDYQFDDKMKQVKEQVKTIIVKWDTWEQQLNDLIF